MHPPTGTDADADGDADDSCVVLLLAHLHSGPHLLLHPQLVHPPTGTDADADTDDSCVVLLLAHLHSGPLCAARCSLLGP